MVCLRKLHIREWLVFLLIIIKVISVINLKCFKAAMENVVSAAICGVLYHLFSGQPLTIIGEFLHLNKTL